MARPQIVDVVEIVAETCFTQRATRREVCALAEIWPVVPHGVKLSLGSADGVDLDRARRLGALARELRAPVISEHVSFTRASGIDIGHLTQLPRTRAAIAVVAKNVAAVRRVLPDVPLILENVAWSFLWPDEEMDEPSFYQEIVAATGCDLLLDLGNLYANALNEGRDPREVLLRYPLDHVAMVHVAGGIGESGFYFDTHAHAIPPGVLALAGDVIARCGRVPLLIERDANFDFAEIARELASLRALRGEPRDPKTIAARLPGALGGGDMRPGSTYVTALAADQRSVAGQLVRGDAPSNLIDPAALERSRGILQRKRIDDALPLIANLALRADEVRSIAEVALAGTIKRNCPHDAWLIAHAAARMPALATPAAIDLLLIRARFTKDLTPRRTPFIGSVRTDDGRRIRATKGIGAHAEVTLRTSPS
jgi:uncharacterized protein (UPF0276 family)